jgi:hypothetical protein
MRTILLLVPVLLILSACSSKDKKLACHQNWSVVEYGSSRVKLLISEVNFCERKVGRELYKVEWEVDTDKGSQSGKGAEKFLGAPTIARTLEVSKDIKNIFPRFKVESVSAIATGTYRSFTNAGEVLSSYSNEIGTKVRILSNEEEAAMGLRSIIVKEKPEGKFVVWDFGGNNMQFTIVDGEKVSHVLGFPGSAPILKSVKSFLNKKTSPNPITSKMQSKTENHIISNFFKKLDPKSFPTDARVFGIGGVHSKSIVSNISTMLGIPLGSSTYGIEHVETLAKKLVTLKDSDMGGQYTESQATNTLTVHAVMSRMGWNRVRSSDQTLALGFMDFELKSK